MHARVVIFLMVFDPVECKRLDLDVESRGDRDDKRDRPAKMTTSRLTTGKWPPTKISLLVHRVAIAQPFYGQSHSQSRFSHPHRQHARPARAVPATPDVFCRVTSTTPTHTAFGPPHLPLARAQLSHLPRPLAHTTRMVLELPEHVTPHRPIGPKEELRDPIAGCQAHSPVLLLRRNPQSRWRPGWFPKLTMGPQYEPPAGILDYSCERQDGFSRSGGCGAIPDGRLGRCCGQETPESVGGQGRGVALLAWGSVQRRGP